MIEIFHGTLNINPEFLLLSVEHFYLVVLLGLVWRMMLILTLMNFAGVGLRIIFIVYIHAHVCMIRMEVRKRGKKTNINYYNKFTYFTVNFSQKRQIFIDTTWKSVRKSI